MLWRLAAAWSLAIVSPAAADWPQARHDAAHTGCTDETVELPLERKWVFEPHSRPAPPFMYADSTLLASGDGLFVDGRGMGLYAVQAETGEVAWQTPERDWIVAVVGDVLVEVFRTPPPVVVGFAVYDTHSGALLGRVSSRDQLSHPHLLAGSSCAQFAHSASCCVNGGVLAFCERREDSEGRDSRWLVAYDVVTGNLAWEIPEERILPLGRRVDSGAQADAFHVWAWGRDLMLLSNFDVGSHGPKAWFGGRRGKPREPVPGPWAVSFSRATAPTPMDAILRPWCGWGDLDSPNTTIMALPRVPSVALADSLGVAIGYEGREGAEALSCRDASSGELRWTQPLLAQPHSASPAVDGSAAYLGLEGDVVDGLTSYDVYAIEMRTGAVRWTHHLKPVPPQPVAGSYPARGASVSAPVCSVAGDMVWVASQHRLIALDAETGEVKWETSETEAGGHEPVIHNGWVYVLTSSGSVEAWGPHQDGRGVKSPGQGG